MSATQSPARITAIVPQFLVDDLKRAITYYRDKLGFELAFQYQDFYAGVTRDGFQIHLKCAPKLPQAREHRKDDEHLDAYISVLGVRSLYSDLERSGAHIIKPLEQQPWDCVDFYVEDPDGNLLCFSEQNA